MRLMSQGSGHPRSRLAQATLLASGLCCLALTSCNRVSPRMEITESRPVSTHEAKPALGASAPERFGDERLKWDTPEGWTRLERNQMRPVNLGFGPQNEGECYLSMLPNNFGGITANVNRWRKQMGQPDLTEDEVAALPRKTLMGVPGVFIEVDGAYKNVGEVEAKADYRLIGVIANIGDAGLFVKMVGPKALVEANAAGFEQFVSSLRLLQ